MSDHIYKRIEVVGTSKTSSDDAIRNAIRKTSDSVRGLRWFEVVELRGDIDGSDVAHWQATVRIGFRLEE
ncbi:dodecin [Thalassoglobus sp. JC818]|uniref:dodecin n=1 Tax=Thalassoglobus sp. JC818 TaxID=3232136 RepID=UPI00345B04FF